MIKTIIVDDESRARETIAEMLKLYCKNVMVIDQAVDVKSGLRSIKKYKPDLVLLDIKMPDGTGFDLVRQLDQANFKIIFITAFEEYAVKAFKFSALDYLLKPVHPEELVMAIEKVSNSLHAENLSSKINEFMTYMENLRNFGYGKKILLKTIDNVYVVDSDEIISVESEDSYSRFHLVGQENIIVSGSIKHYINLLKEHNFYRVHNTFMINPRHVKRYKRDESTCIMSDGSEVPISYRKREQLFNLFKKMG
ncbi:MAG TPA: response regulator transcription factor [Bacteroidales bacterium]|nr:response regulator transcription factor [Bacteroidales bacterium]